MITSFAEVLAQETSQIGVTETGDNDVLYTRWYGEVGWSWCAIFQCWAFFIACHSNGERSPLEDIDFPKGPAYTGSMMAAGQSGRNGLGWRPDPVPGSLAIYDWDWAGITDHVGLVESVQGGPHALFTAIEGNTTSGDAGDQSNGDGVWRRQRSNNSGYVRGFVTIPWGPGGKHRPTPSPLPWFYRQLALVSPLMTGSDVSRYQDRMIKRGWTKAPDILDNTAIDVTLRFYLRNAGYRAGAPFTADGVFGPLSCGVTMAFQLEKGLVVDGVVGPVTINAAYRDDNVTA